MPTRFYFPSRPNIRVLVTTRWFNITKRGVAESVLGPYRFRHQSTGAPPPFKRPFIVQGTRFFLGRCICEQVSPCYLCLITVHSHMDHIMIFQFLSLITILVNICSSGDICKLEDPGERGRRATFMQTVIIEDSRRYLFLPIGGRRISKPVSSCW